MSRLCVSLLGKFRVRCDDQDLNGLDSAKAQELFGYLLLHRDRPHAREALASLLWGDHCTTVQSKKYLRNALWRLQAALGHRPELVSSDLLLVDPDWIQLQTVTLLWLDTAVLEAAYAVVRDIPGRDLNIQAARELEGAVQLYRGNLLESWCQDWCICERERLLQIYLITLDKLMEYAEVHHEFEQGLSYGQHILQHDRAREHTHRQMMRLYHLAGYRTEALRQYERCAAALQEELDVEPAQRTLALYQQIRADQLDRAASREVAEAAILQETLTRLQHMQASLAEFERQVECAAKAVATWVGLSHPPDGPEQGEDGGAVA